MFIYVYYLLSFSYFFSLLSLQISTSVTITMSVCCSSEVPNEGETNCFCGLKTEEMQGFGNALETPILNIKWKQQHFKSTPT